MKELFNQDFKPLKIDNLEDFIKYSLLPAIYEENEIFITTKEKLIDALNFYNKTNLDYQIYITDKNSYERLFSKLLEFKTQKELQNSKIENEIEEELNLDILKNGLDILEENSAPIIQFVNSLFYQAIQKEASDIHIETHETFGIIRFRIDGILLTQATIEKQAINLIINRIKVISDLDISEKRIPQDGRTQIKISNKATDIRVSVLPTYYGEKVVMRLLMQSESIPSLENLGFDEEIIKGFKNLLEHSYGMILVTGPTGSGKSTTLHAFLQTISTPEKNIITIEDPVEYKSDSINQIQVNEKVGLTFATGLRSILRQDPDIIMVGEIRDKETANTAIQAALTGHLMLSTLHTNNAIATITRLLDIGIKPYLLSSSIIGILSQRLVRILCDCKIKNGEFYEAKGCIKCNFTGYKHRKVIGELLIMNDEIKALIANNATEIEIKKIAKYKTLNEQLKTLLINGETSLKEAIRVGLKD